MPHGTSPPTAPGIRITYQAVRSIPRRSATLGHISPPVAQRKPPGVRLRTFPMHKRQIYKAHPLRMENFAVTCQLVPGVPHLLSGSSSSPCMFGLGFLLTPSRDDALALLLAFGSANTWREGLHFASSVPCPAHTTGFSGGAPLAHLPNPQPTPERRPSAGRRVRRHLLWSRPGAREPCNNLVSFASRRSRL